MKLRIKILLTAVAAGLLFSARAALEPFTLKTELAGTVVDWTDGASYVGDTAPTDLANAKITVDNVTYLVDATTITNFCKVKWVNMSGTDARIEVDTGTGTNTMTGAVSGSNGNGFLVKKGAGKLSLSSVGVTSSSATVNYDCFTGYDVREGELALPQSNAGYEKLATMYIGTLNVESNATFVLGANIQTWIGSTSSMTGGGVITSAGGNFMPQWNNAEPCVFSGEINGGARFYSCANLNLTGTNSMMSGLPLIYGHGSSARAIGVMTLGKRSLRGSGNVILETYPSSLGSADTITFQEGGGHIRYLGSGENCTKTFKVGHSSPGSIDCRGVLDAGPYGGLVLSSLVAASESQKVVQCLELTGSNRNECVYSGTSESYVRMLSTDTRSYTNHLHIIKGGTGTWRFTHNNTRDGISGVTVREGVLSFATLNEFGVKSSFGTGLMQDGTPSFYPAVIEIYDAAHRVPYQFTLGDANADTVGTFALAGATGCVCSTRPIAIAGLGALSNGYDSARMRIAGVTPLAGDRAKTLYLDGSSTAENELQDVTNDVSGTLSVVKRGSGKWILSGNQTFGGGLGVEGGELVVRTEQPEKKPFSWFRLILKENWGEYQYGALCDAWAKNTFVFNKKGFALYDAAGNNLASNCTVQAADYASVGENEVAYCDPARRSLDYASTKGLLGATFGNMMKDADRWVGGLERPYLAKPETWVKVDLRLPEGSKVAAVDFMALFGYDHTQITKWDDRGKVTWGHWNYSSNTKYFNMQGSTDGIHWEPLFDQDVYCEGTNYNVGAWFFGDAYTNTVAKGLPLDHTVSTYAPATTVLPNGVAASVTGGGTLRVEGDPVTVTSLALDAASAATLSNVTFAASGTLSVSGTLEGGDIELPGTFQDVTGLDNLASGWTLSAGKYTRRYRVVNRNGKLHLVKNGFVLYLK